MYMLLRGLSATAEFLVDSHCQRHCLCFVKLAPAMIVGLQFTALLMYLTNDEKTKATRRPAPHCMVLPCVITYLF